jgi:FhuF 2Fe-2S C-terminal domain
MSDALDAALARIAEARAGGYGLYVARRDEPGDGWHAGPELLSEDGPLEELVADVARSAGTDLPRVGAEWLLELVAWHGAVLTAAAMMSGRWVPDLTPGNVFVGVKDGSVMGVALRGGEPREHAGDEELARAGHAALLELFEPLIDALVARRLRPRRALWRAAGDRIGQAFMWCADAYGDPERARWLAERMIAPPSPLHVPLEIGSGEDGQPVLLRASCCLWHRAPESSLCPGCPLRRRGDAAVGSR